MMIVLRPIEVPSGNYCWLFQAQENLPVICDHFTNEGGRNFCEMFRTGLLEDQNGVLKCEPCSNCLSMSELGEETSV